jgi:hypothetical protein
MHPIIPFEDLPSGIQIFLTITSLFILIGCGHVVLQMIRAMLGKNK